jgi:hypothetical protein
MRASNSHELDEYLVDLRWPDERAVVCAAEARRARAFSDERLEVEIPSTGGLMRALGWCEREQRMWALAAVQSLYWLLCDD